MLEGTKYCEKEEEEEEGRRRKRISLLSHHAGADMYTFILQT